MISIFNNGSYAWIVLALTLVLVIVFGYKAYVGHKAGYHRQDQATGKWIDTPKSIWSNGYFKMALLAAVLGAFMTWLINSEYL